MQVKAIKTPIIKKGDNLISIITQAIPKVKENSVLVITSKVVSFEQQRMTPKKTGEKAEKQEIVKQEADYYLPPHSSKYNLMLTIKNNTLAVNAGIDESNAQNNYILWPEKLQETCNHYWQELRKHYQVKNLGIIITDSRTVPLMWGVIGTSIAHCGFQALQDRRGDQDLFGYTLQMVQVNVAEAIAVAAVFEMGEVNEQTPLAVVEQVKHIEFQDRPPTEEELNYLRIEIEDDVYGPLLQSVKWESSTLLSSSELDVT